LQLCRRATGKKRKYLEKEDFATTGFLSQEFYDRLKNKFGRNNRKIYK
jgi:hypothetical protein